MIKQSKLVKIKSKILSNLFNEKYGLKFGEFDNTTETERVKVMQDSVLKSRQPSVRFKSVLLAEHCRMLRTFKSFKKNSC